LEIGKLRLFKYAQTLIRLKNMLRQNLPANILDRVDVVLGDGIIAAFCQHFNELGTLARSA
jgi:hypothetical protein